MVLDMKRRDVLKGAAVVAGAAVLGFPAVAKGEVTPLMSTTHSPETRRMMVELHIYPDADGKFRGPFQERVEEWERANEGMRAVEALFFSPQMEHAQPWLRHPAWEPMSKDNLSMLYTESRTIFRERRWDVIERAINMREQGYWRQEYLPQMPTGPAALDGGGASPAYTNMRMFHRITRSRLHEVLVRFEAIPLSAIERHDDEYGQLELEVLVLEDLRKEGKLTPRAYYMDRNERFEKLGLIEVAALEGIKS